MEQLKTPVAIIVFKRLDATKKMFEAVRAVQPKELFIIADGWRNEKEKEKCLAVRSYLDTAVDWPCVVHKDYSDKNLGCKMRVVSGLYEVFKKVEDAIIVEDDCVPDVSFFEFCEELLERYRHEPTVMQIAGLNVQQKNKNFTTNGASYYFSQFGEIWGWATWRRAWNLYDVSISKWPQVKAERVLEKRLKDPGVVDYWEHRFDEIYEAGDDMRKFDAWAAQWVFAQLLYGGLSAVPKTNLIQNFGDDEDATRVKDIQAPENYRRPVIALTFPLQHPAHIEVNTQADDFTLYEGFRIKRKISEKILFFFKRYMPSVHNLLRTLKK